MSIVADDIAKVLVPIHMHSDHSLGDGAQSVESIVVRCAKIGYNSVSLTDHGTMTGCYPLERLAAKKGIKPLHGCEVYVSECGDTLDDIKEFHEKRREEKKSASDEERVQTRSHLVLIAQNDIGYVNLLNITNEAITNRTYRKPMTTWDIIANNSEGLIATTACLASKLSSAILRDDIDGFIGHVNRLKSIFSDRLFLELQLNSLPEQAVYNAALIEASKQFNVQTVLGMDAHYSEQKDGILREVIVANRYGRQLDGANFFDDDDNLLVSNQWENWLKSPSEVFQFWSNTSCNIDERTLIKSCEATRQISDLTRFQFASLVYGYRMPHVAGDQKQRLKDLAKQGLIDRATSGFIDPANIDQYVARLKLEIDQICDKNFEGYFTVLYDVLRDCRSQGTEIGSGRGSAAGSLVSYVLGITDVDPIRFNLSFERFLNPARGKIVADLGL